MQLLFDFFRPRKICHGCMCEFDQADLTKEVKHFGAGVSVTLNFCSDECRELHAKRMYMKQLREAGL